MSAWKGLRNAFSIESHAKRNEKIRSKSKTFQANTLSKFDGIDEFGEYRIDNGIKLYKKYSNRILSSGLRYFLNSQRKLLGSNFADGRRFAYIEFGVFNGRATHSFANFLNAKGRSYNLPLEAWDFFLFDSWQGLPPQQDDADAIAIYAEGDYTSEGEGYVRERLESAGVDSAQIHTYSGWFSDTLNEATRHAISEIHPLTAFVCFDCDYYSSTRDALNWVEPLLLTGTPLYFDDIHMYFGSKNKGQIKAIEEFNEGRTHTGLYKQMGMDSQSRMYSFWNDAHIETGLSGP